MNNIRQVLAHVNDRPRSRARGLDLAPETRAGLDPCQIRLGMLCITRTSC